MKKGLLLLFSVFLVLSCTKDSFKNSNPYLPNYSFSTTLNLSLPQYNPLLYPTRITSYNVCYTKLLRPSNFGAACEGDHLEARVFGNTARERTGLENWIGGSTSGAFCADKVSYNFV